MHTPQKSEVRPDAPERDGEEMFCRDCADYDIISIVCDIGYCLHHNQEIDGDDIRRCFQRRNDASD